MRDQFNLNPFGNVLADLPQKYENIVQPPLIRFCPGLTFVHHVNELDRNPDFILRTQHCSSQQIISLQIVSNFVDLPFSVFKAHRGNGRYYSQLLWIQAAKLGNDLVTQPINEVIRFFRPSEAMERKYRERSLVRKHGAHRHETITTL